jgi:hypothetical protein
MFGHTVRKPCAADANTRRVAISVADPITGRITILYQKSLGKVVPYVLDIYVTLLYIIAHLVAVFIMHVFD